MNSSEALAHLYKAKELYAVLKEEGSGCGLAISY